MHKYKVGRYYHKKVAALSRISVIAISAIPEISDRSGPGGELSQKESFHGFERQDRTNLAHIVFATGSVFVGHAFEKLRVPELIPLASHSCHNFIYISG